MKIFIKERKLGKEAFPPQQMLFDIVIKADYGENEKEANEKASRFRDKVDKLKRKDGWVGQFMPMPDANSYAFFVVTCFLGRRIKMKEFIEESIEDGDLLLFK